MEKKFSARELSYMTDIAKEVLPVIVTQSIKSEGMENWPEVFEDFAEISFSIASAMLKKRQELIGVK